MGQSLLIWLTILQILLVIVESLAKLSVDIQDKDLVYNLLLVLSGMLMDEKGEIIYCRREIISVFLQTLEGWDI